MVRYLLLTIFLISPYLLKSQSPENARAAQIFSVGLTVGYAEYGAMKGDKPSFLAEKLQYAIDNAEATGCIPTSRLKEIRRKMLATSNSNSLYREIESYRRDILFNEILSYCNCSISITPSTSINNPTSSSSDFTPQLRLSKTNYNQGEAIIVNYSEFAGNNDDWIALFKKGSVNEDFLQPYQYTMSKKSGTMTFTQVLPPGEYEVRGFFNDSYKMEVVVSFTISAKNDNNQNTNQPEINSTNPAEKISLQLSKSNYGTGEPITVIYSGFGGNQDDWIALYKKGNGNTSFIDPYQYTKGKKSGTMTFTQVLPPGEYEVRGFFKNSYEMEGAISFTVGTNLEPEIYVQLPPPNNGNNSNGPSLILNKTAYAIGENITVSFRNMPVADPGNNVEWISILDLTIGEKAYVTQSNEYHWTGGVKDGEVSFKGIMKSGSYTVRAFGDSTWNKVVAQTTITIK